MFCSYQLLTESVSGTGERCAHCASVPVSEYHDDGLRSLRKLERHELSGVSRDLSTDIRGFTCSSVNRIVSQPMRPEERSLASGFKVQHILHWKRCEIMQLENFAKPYATNQSHELSTLYFIHTIRLPWLPMSRTSSLNTRI